MPDPEDPLPPEPNHRNHDAFMEDVPAASKFPSRAAGVETASRRKQSCLGVTRTACLQPIGASREDFYEHRLLLTLPWRCEDGPASNAAGQEWSFLWDPPSYGPAPVELRNYDKPTQSFEKICKDIELDICSFPEKICACCAVAESEVCKSCRFAVGFHRCEKKPDQLLWRRNCLHGEEMDCERALWNLHRKMVPTSVIRDKAREYEAAGLMKREQAHRMVKAIEEERILERVANGTADGEEDAEGDESGAYSQEELKKLLAVREENMRSGAGDGVPDQYRVYTDITGAIERGEYLRMLVQASAGTGKSYLLSSVSPP